MAEILLGVSQKPYGKRLIYTDSEGRIVYSQLLDREIKQRVSHAMNSREENKGLVCYLTKEKFETLSAKTEELHYSLRQVLQTSKLFLQIHNKYHFVLRCHLDKKARNFPTANLLETALLEFDIAVRDYQREVPDDVKQCQGEEIEGYVLSVDDMRKLNANPDEVKSFALAQRKYLEEIVRMRR